jgi:hypothetical protein
MAANTKTKSQSATHPAESKGARLQTASARASAISNGPVTATAANRKTRKRCGRRRSGRFHDLYFIRHSRRAKGLAFCSDPEPGFYVFLTHIGHAEVGPFQTRSEARRARREMLVSVGEGA